MQDTHDLADDDRAIRDSGFTLPGTVVIIRLDANASPASLSPV
jgi:hypothetical protein